MEMEAEAKLKMIMDTLREHPGARLSTIAWMVPMGKMEVLDILHYLKRQGKVFTKAHHDTANMEFYDMWYLKQSEDKIGC